MRAAVTGAAGFAGIHLSGRLLESGYGLLAFLRKGSEHNGRIRELAERFPEGRVCIIEYDMDTEALPELINDKTPRCGLFFDMAWAGGRNDMAAQLKNTERLPGNVEAAVRLGCRRYIGTGSQAEYGVVSGVITEDTPPLPFSAYGAAKLAGCHISRVAAESAGIEWIWGRIFSLTGSFEPSGRMLPDLVGKLKRGEAADLSSCRQYWDYMDAADCADAFIALGEKGRAGSIYNVANGDYRVLKDYIEELRELIPSESEIRYGSDPEPFVSLRPDVSRLKQDTGFRCRYSFSDSIRKICLAANL